MRIPHAARRTPRTGLSALATGVIGPYRGAVTRTTGTEWIVDRAVLPHCVLASACITTASGRITGIRHAEEAPDEAGRLRGTLLPGFVDLQVNGAGGRSIDEATPEALDTVAQAVWAGGAVAFLPTLITAPWEQLLEQVAAVSAWIRRWDGEGAEPLGLHVEGPFLVAAGAHDGNCFLDPTPARLEALLDAGGGTVRLVTLGNARPGAAAAVAFLRAHGVGAAIGHCDRTAGFAECVDAGATAVTHLFNVMGALHHRDVGVAGLALDDERLTCPLILDGVHVHPAMVRNAFRILGPDRFALVTDAVGAAGMPDGEYHLAGIRVFAQDGVVRDADGRLAGSALTMAHCARNFLRFVPMAGAWSLARVASGNPARLAGASDRYGAITVGRTAAFTLLGDDGDVRCLRCR